MFVPKIFFFKNFTRISRIHWDRTARNQIFSAQQAAGGIPVRDVLKDDFGINIPIEAVPLPSLGAVYPAESAAFNRETVDIKAMTAREEDILTSNNSFVYSTHHMCYIY